MSAPSITRIPSINSQRRTTVSNKQFDSVTDENTVQSSRISIKNNKKSNESIIRKPLSVINNNNNNATINNISKELPIKPYSNDAKSYSELKKSELILYNRVNELELKLAVLNANNIQLQNDYSDSEIKYNKLVDTNQLTITRMNDELRQIQLNHDNTIKQLQYKYDDQLESKSQLIDQLNNKLSLIESRLHHNNIDVITLQPMNISTQQHENQQQFSTSLEQTIQTLTKQLNHIQNNTDQTMNTIQSWNQLIKTNSNH